MDSDRSRPRYPIFIPSKGRWTKEMALTVKTLRDDGIDFRVVVEPQEEEEYLKLGVDPLVLPFSNLGLGSVPARNWIRDYAASLGWERHWVLDDNIFSFYRVWEGQRVPVHAGVSLRVCEDLTDRFENVGVSGLNYDMFVIPFGGSGISTPYFRNVHVYSCCLVSAAMPCRWRGRYNEDTDLCLQALVNGWCTLLVNAFTAKKVTTMTMGGGNTDGLYDGMSERDTMGRFEMARSLEKAWPGLVKISRKYGRYQHSVDWGRFAGLSLRLRSDAALERLPEVDEYGLSLRPVRDVRSALVRRLYEEYEDRRDACTATDPFWWGLPAFRPIAKPPKLVLTFKTEEEREKLVKELGVTVDKRYADKGWSAWYPPRGRNDPASLRFDLKEAA